MNDSEHSLSEDDLSIRAYGYPTGWLTALQRAPRIECWDVAWEFGDVRVTTVKTRPQQVSVHSFTFPETPDCRSRYPRQDAVGRASGHLFSGPSHQKTSSEVTTPKQTRLRPAGEIIKLQDRLYYLLQPPLETVFAGEALRFPFQPFPYQMDGVGFLFTRHSAVLADEMGLGKTMQAITTIRLLLHTAEIESVLLVCPKPLVTNWQREFGLWAPEMPVLVVSGDQERRRWQWNLADIPVRIANYELLMRDRAQLCSSGMQFDLVVLDEAQRIKNRWSTTSQIVRGLHRQRSWALTGTPIENSPDDLVGIFEYVSPGLLSPGMTPREMGRMVSDYVLRRTKDLVLTEMPPKLFCDVEISLSDEQRESYDLAESNGVLRLASMQDTLTIQHVFELVLRLKQICNFDPATGHSSKSDRLLADIEEVSTSGKKAIVFSQWVQTLVRLRERLSSFNPLEYHGRIPSARRDGVIEQFREDPDCSVLLMSYGAGSVGLNLQFAEYVFLFDRWWNPAVEDQAINRAHRIGVTGPVTVTRFVTVGTIEERINQILWEKRELFDCVLGQTGAPSARGLSQQDILGLFDLSLPRADRAAG